MKREARHYILETTGRELPICSGILGINSESNITEGYDSTFYFRDDDLADGPLLTVEERQEIAAHMIKQWRAWANPPASE